MGCSITAVRDLADKLVEVIDSYSLQLSVALEAVV